MLAAKDQIPSEVEGIPVTFVPKATPRGTGLGGFLQISITGANTYDPEAAAHQEKEDRVLGVASSDAMQTYGQQPNDLPGVIGVGPGKCKGSECDFTTIKIVVRAQFLDDVKEQIPTTVNDLPLVFIPYTNDQ